MNSSIYRFTLDMHSAQSQVSIPTMLGDTGRTLRINLSDDSNPYSIADGCLAKISIKRPTGTRLEDFCTIEGNTTIVYPFSENTCATEGIHECDVTLYGLDGSIITSPRFTMVVSERVVRSDDIVVTDEDQAVIDAMVVAEAVRQNAEAEREAKEKTRQETVAQFDDAIAKATSEADRAEVAASSAVAEAEALIKETAKNTAKNEAAGYFAEETNPRLEAVESTVSTVQKRIVNLEKGISHDPYVTDGAVAYSKGVPNNALPYAEIEKVGGAVTSIESHGKNLVNPAAFSSGVLSPEGVTHQGVTVKYLPDEDCFLIDGTNKGGNDGSNATQIVSTYFAVKNVPGTNYTLSAKHISGTMTGTEAYFYAGAADTELYKTNWLSLQFSTRSSNTKQNNYALITAFWFYLYKGVSFDNYKVRFQLERGTTATEYSKYKALVDSRTIPQAVQNLVGYGEANPDNAEEYNYIDFEAKKFVAYGYLSDGVWVAYNAPQETDVSAYIDIDDNLIEVEAGGSLVFVNENGLEVPSAVTYMVKEDKV